MKILMEFTKIMAVLESSGMELYDSLSAALLISPKGKLAKVINDIICSMNEGYSFSEGAESAFCALDNFTRYCFRNVSTEDTGKGFFNLLTHRYERKCSVKHNLIWALAYPSLMGFFLIGGLALLGYVFIPRLISFFPIDDPQKLFLIIRRIDFLLLGTAIILSMIFLGCLLFVLEKKKKFLKGGFYKSILKIPVLGKMYSSSSHECICATMSLLLRRGVSFKEALKGASESVNNSAFKQELLSGIQKMEEGVSPQAIFLKSSVLSPLFKRWFNLEIESRKPGDAMASLAKYYQKKLNSLFEHIDRGIEPAAIFLIGGVLLYAVIGCILPLMTGTFF